jgi:hypothetical protein
VAWWKPSAATMTGAGTFRAAPQTAVILVVTRRYSSGLLNFAAHSPEDSQTRQKTPFCAPLTDCPEGIVPVQNDGSVRLALDEN